MRLPSPSAPIRVRLSIFLAVAIVLPALAGCGDGSDESTAAVPEDYAVVPLWRDQWDSGDTAATGFDRPSSIVAAGGVVVVSGNGGTPFSSPDGILRAYDAETGNLLWSRSDDGAECAAAAGEMAVIGERLFVGTTQCELEEVRALDLRSGQRLWATGKEEESVQPHAPHVIADGSRVASVEWHGQGVTLQVQDPVDGAVLWRADSDLYFHSRISSNGRTLVLSGLRPDVPRRLRLFAYSAATGELAWSHAYPKTSFPISNPLYGLAFGPGVVVTATAAANSSFSTTIQAREEFSGEKLWSTKTSTYVRDLVADAERVYAIGLFQGNVRRKSSVSAYSLETGELLWWDVRHEKKVDEQAEWVLLDDNRLIVSGKELQMRVYDAATGEVLDEALRGSEFAMGYAIAADSGNIYSLAGAYEGDPDQRNKQDFLLRAFHQQGR